MGSLPLHATRDEIGTLIQFEGVTYRYSRRARPALQNLSWALESPRTVLLGPNGAGKSTLLALGANVLSPQQGAVSALSGEQARGSRGRVLRRAVGWMPQHVPAVKGLTSREQCAYAGWLKGMSKSDAWAEAKIALDWVGLLELEDKKAAHLSGGQLRRLGLASVLVSRPQHLLLDEPTVGLDPAQRSRFRGLLKDLEPVRECTILVSTHLVDDIGELFDQVAVLDEGQIRFSGSTDEFLALGGESDGDLPSAERAYSAIVEREV